VLTVSDTRNYETDKGGQLIQTLLKDENINIKRENYQIVKDDQEAIHSQLQTWLQQKNIDVIITTGGTGIAQRDVTIEVVRPLLDKEIEG
ncbi:MogA/MoaB family molybdenum cofactor biosynthesis protein, partial [Bacillus cereus group sp. Bce006]